MINEKAFLKCNKCNEEGCILNWKFECKFHIDEYKSIDVDRLTWSLGAIMTIAHKNGDKIWGRTLSSRVSEIAMSS